MTQTVYTVWDEQNEWLFAVYDNLQQAVDDCMSEASDTMDKGWASLSLCSHGVTGEKVAEIDGFYYNDPEEVHRLYSIYESTIVKMD